LPLPRGLNRHFLSHLTPRTPAVCLAPMEPDPKSLHRITLQLPVPVQDSKTLLKLLQLELQAHPPKAPVKKVLLTLEAAPPRNIQGELFIPPGPEPQRMEITLARIKAIAGETRVGSPVLRNTHRPDAFEMGRFLPSEETLGARTSRPPLAAEGGQEMNGQHQGQTGRPRSQEHSPALPHSALRRFRPAVPACVEMKCAVPAFITFHNQRRKVIAQAGPWRNSGDWWNESPWARDAWDVTLVERPSRAQQTRPFETVSNPESAVYRVYLDLHTQQWFVEGMYD
jgi:protein ImuB